MATKKKRTLGSSKIHGNNDIIEADRYEARARMHATHGRCGSAIDDISQAEVHIGMAIMDIVHAPTGSANVKISTTSNRVMSTRNFIKQKCLIPGTLGGARRRKARR